MSPSIRKNFIGALTMSEDFASSTSANLAGAVIEEFHIIQATHVIQYLPLYLHGLAME